MEAIRHDSKEKQLHNKKGEVIKVIPAFYTIAYKVNGNEIANYNSKDNVCYLRTDYLSREFKKPYTERIKGSRYEAEFTELIDTYSKISEFMNAF